MQEKNGLFSNLFQKGELPQMEFAMTDDFYLKTAGMLIISFLIIIAFAGITYKNVKCG